MRKFDYKTNDYEDVFYVYALLDPRHQNEKLHPDFKFEYQPFYIGYGQYDRINQHFMKHSLVESTIKNNTIKNKLFNLLYPSFNMTSISSL